ncbi:MAG TPA: nucleotide exchange factor GrpE [Candidatus Limnocylindria bacterium]|nr:nucleotide exchange factor GrpE [Candidatus Limnocylindria bacterium]
MTDQKTDGDARPRTRAEERAESVRTPTRSELLERLEEAIRERDTARQQSEEHLRNWQRSAADFSNFKRRTDDERAVTARFSNQLLIGKLLGVLDDFDRALESVPADAHESWVEGVRLVDRKLRTVLESEGVTPIEAIGQPFDPNVAEAVVHEQTTDYPDNQVIGELQRGYRLHDRVIRPALVRVANNPKEH